MRRIVFAKVMVILCAAVAYGQTLTRVRIQSKDAPAVAARLAAEGFDVLEGTATAESFDLIVSDSSLRALKARGFAPIVVQIGRPFREIQAEPDGPGVPVGYLSLAEINAEMEAAAAAFPAICKAVNVTTTYGAPNTFEGRQILAVKISDNVNVDEDEPAYMVVSAHHCREIVTPVIALHAIEQFTTRYGTDPTITSLVDGYEIWIAPVWNVDGYEYVFNVNNLWRKNRRVFPGGTGVDLNRNYPFGWTAPCSGSTSVTSDTYKGPSAGSEAETQTLMLWSQQERFAKVLDFHSSGRETLYSYNCLTDPLAAFWRQEAVAISNASGYGGAVRLPSAEGEHYEWQLATFGAHAFLTETHVEFQPAYASAQAEASQLFPSLIAQLQRPISVSGRVTDASTTLPLAATVRPININYVNGETNGSGGPFGRYHVFLPAGSHTLQFSATGYVTQQHVVNVTSTSAQALNVALVPVAPPALTIALVSGPSELEPPGSSPAVEVDVIPGTQQVVPGSPTVFHRYDGGMFVATPLTPAGGNRYTATLPAVQCGDAPEFYLQARGDGGATVVLPEGAPGTVFSFEVGELTVVLADNFETNMGWTEQNLGATSGDWERGVPVNDPGWAYDPISDSDGSGQCYLTWNAPGNTDVDNGAVQLTSPVFDLSAGGATIAYDYYLNLTNTTGAVDRLLVEISSNAGAGPWIEIARHTTNGGLDWRHHETDAATLAGLGVTFTSQMQVRFIANDANPQSIVEGGVDAFKVFAVRCGGVTCTRGDVNDDGTIDGRDVDLFAATMIAGGPPGTVAFCATDMDGDGTLEPVEDTVLFVDCLVNAICP